MTSRHDLDSTFQELGLSSGANEKQIKAAYRKRVRSIHPDVIGGDGSPFKDLTARVDLLLVTNQQYQYVFEKGEDPSKNQRWRQEWEHHYRRSQAARRRNNPQQADLASPSTWFVSERKTLKWLSFKARVLAGLVLCSLAFQDQYSRPQSVSDGGMDMRRQSHVVYVKGEKSHANEAGEGGDR